MSIFPQNKFQGLRQHLLVGVLFFILSIIFCWPLLSHLYYTGRGDWDLFYFIHASHQIAFLSYHQILLWNPYSSGGVTAIGNPLNPFFSIDTLLTIIFGVIAGCKISVFVHVLIGFVGMYLLNQHLKINFWSGLIASIIFLFCGTFVCRIAEGQLIWLPAYYTPFLFFFLLKSLTNKKFIAYMAILLAVIFYEGSTYITIYSLLFITIFSFFYALERKSIDPIFSVAKGGCIFFLLSAPKSLPFLEFFNQNPRPTEEHFVIPWQLLYGMFLDPNQSAVRIIPWGGGTIGWWELGCYIGIVPVGLLILSLKTIKKNKALWGTLITTFLISIGSFASWSPWTILHHFPLLNSSHIPFRFIVYTIFSMSLLIGLHLNSWESRGRLRFIQFLIFVIILSDLLLINSSTLNHAIRPFTANPQQQITLLNPTVKNHGTFEQIEIKPPYQWIYGAWSHMYPVVVVNKGLTNGYEPIPIKISALPKTNPNDRGEVYFQNKKGEVTIKSWSPNKLVYSVHVKDEDILVVNQNFDHNWHVSNPLEVISTQGLLSTKVSPGSHEITFWYWPNSLTAGLILFLIGVLAITKKFAKNENH